MDEILRTLTADEATIDPGTESDVRMIAATIGPRELPAGIKAAW